MTTASDTSWPQLSTIKFISGRAATDADVTEGKAVFVLKDGEKPIGHSIDIQLPQYAFYLEDGRKVPVAVIQAEGARGQGFMGAIDTSGDAIAGLASDFQLLGTKTP